MLEVLRQVAVHGQQIVDLMRRISVLEAMFWTTVVLLMANLATSWATLRNQKANSNGRKERSHE